MAAASDLVVALPELGKDFKQRTGTRLVPSFGASGILSQQIRHGAPYEVFLSADRRYVEVLGIKARRVYAQGRLAIWSAKRPLAGLEDLTRPEVTRIALANPVHAPYGRAARQALERAGLWSQVQPKLILAESIRHSLEMAESGNVEVAFVAVSLLDPGKGHSWRVPESLHDPLEQEAALLIRTPQAEAFFQYLGSTAAKEILRRYGFIVP